MIDQKMREMLQDLLSDAFSDDENDFPFPRDIRSYEEAGIMTHDEGMVVKMSDGSEFQITIVQSR